MIFYCKKKNGVIIKKYSNSDSIEQDLGKLSYIVNTHAELVWFWQDGFGNESINNADFVVTVLDVQDTPPAFFNLPYSVVVGEDKAVVCLFVCLFVYSLIQMAYIRS